MLHFVSKKLTVAVKIIVEFEFFSKKLSVHNANVLSEVCYILKIIDMNINYAFLIYILPWRSYFCKKF